MSVKYRSNRREIVARFKGGVHRNVEKAANEFLGELNKTLRRGPRSGELYLVPGGVRRTYIASAPGEPPAPRTGTLAGSYQAVPIARTRMLVGTPLAYGRFMELGTSTVRPRPHFAPTFIRMRRRLRAILGEEVV